MNWIVIVGYPQDRRFVGPFPSQEDALRWVSGNSSPLWLGCEAVPLETPGAPDTVEAPRWR